jgi:hypothetical protein
MKQATKCTVAGIDLGELYMLLFDDFALTTSDIARAFEVDMKGAYNALSVLESETGLITGEYVNSHANRGEAKRVPGKVLTWQCNATYDSIDRAEAIARAERRGLPIVEAATAPEVAPEVPGTPLIEVLADPTPTPRFQLTPRRGPEERELSGYRLSDAVTNLTYYLAPDLKYEDADGWRFLMEEDSQTWGSHLPLAPGYTWVPSRAEAIARAVPTDQTCRLGFYAGRNTKAKLLKSMPLASPNDGRVALGSAVEALCLTGWREVTDEGVWGETAVLEELWGDRVMTLHLGLEAHA